MVATKLIHLVSGQAYMVRVNFEEQLGILHALYGGMHALKMKGIVLNL